ncbi:MULTISPECIES: dynamin family protein [Stenotrophomonas]|uniref:dynamin family protein n=1 Tax=Stenotrophomonas TaxID=40323 RepID=UPI0015F63C13|nr:MULTISPECIES: dynamin family protein [Stenotrophomonas]MBN5160273.1 dynamin family protein [Stenotrophomonas maltophilia]MDG9845213.1 dynamin family protein [Stenotrophomonas sp. GD04054]MDH0016451.1 dynamin family protein [Stenotrophomonas sp. GD04028]MDH0576690.1 dynamin family protein [Stenotrophomonas sp. GD03997]MDH0860613.1 dynamin family protein [Stenotrophomonas sp. GD03882]
MSAEVILDRQQKLITWLAAHADILNGAVGASSQWEIDTIDSLKEALLRLDDENRLMDIGIVGRVKAGKSTLLNALVFNGESVLPQAATPMTAALTTLTYGERFKATARFYSQADLANIEQAAAVYSDLLEKSLIEELRRTEGRAGLDPERRRELAERGARRALATQQPSLQASHEQWAKITASGLSLARLKEDKPLEADDVEGLAALLADYVAAEGHYMPVTKSVDIEMPVEALRGLRIIDTPGLNDPVASREARTHDLLKCCDVVFVVSPAAQFMSQEDLDVMARITAAEGIRELVLVASQVDNTLHGSEMQAQLHASLTGLRRELAGHAGKVLDKLKLSNPEVGDVFQSLVDKGEDAIIHSSGMCHSMSVEFDSVADWQGGRLTAWQNLKETYPDYFRDDNPGLSRTNLDQLANMAGLHEVVEQTRLAKARVLAARRQDLLDAKERKQVELLRELRKKLALRAGDIGDVGLTDLKKNKRALERKRIDLTRALDEKLMRVSRDFVEHLEASMERVIDSAFDAADSGVKRTVGTETRKVRVESHGALNWLAKKLWDGGYREYDETEATILPASVKASVSAFASKLRTDLNKEARHEQVKFDRALFSELVSTARNELGDELDIEAVYSALKSIVNSVDFPKVSIRAPVLGTPAATVKLRGEQAGQYLAEAMHAIHTLQNAAQDAVSGYVEGVWSKIPKSVAGEFIGYIQSQFDALQKLMEEAEKTRATLTMMDAELEAMQ